MNDEQVTIVEVDSSGETVESTDALPSSEDSLDAAGEDSETLELDVETSVFSDGDAIDDGEVVIVDFLELDFVEDLQRFYNHYLVETPEGFIQIFQSLTYGEMLISFLLLLLIVLYVMKWIYEIVRY